MSDKRVYGLDLVRSIAILLVLFLHMTESVPGTPFLLKKMFGIGWAGVDLFFVLSGFLIGSQIYKENNSYSLGVRLNNFWVKRWFRTLPLYFVFLFIYAVVKPVLGWKFNDEIMPFFFFLQNYFAPTDFVQSWSLCIEEQFYVLFPLICYLLPFVKKHFLLWFLPIIGSIYMRWTVIESAGHMNAADFAYNIIFPSHTHMDGICFGVILAFSRSYWDKIALGNSKVLTCAGTILFFCTMFLIGPISRGWYGVLGFTGLAISGCLMVMGGCYLKIKGPPKKILYWVSILSYSAYLWNNLFTRLIEKYFENVHWVFGSIIFLAMTFAVSAVTYNVIEKPFISWRERFLKA